MTTPPKSAEAPRVWQVKCLRETFVPHGALLLGPEIKTDEYVIEKSAYATLQKDYAVCDAERDTLKLRCDQLQKRCQDLEKERVTYRTLSALMSDNASMCELYDDVEALEEKVKILVEALMKILDGDSILDDGIIAREALEKVGVK